MTEPTPLPALVPEPLGTTRAYALARIAALLGGNRTWDEPADLLEAIADLVATTDLPHPGHADAETIAAYRDLAWRVGLDVLIDDEDQA